MTITQKILAKHAGLDKVLEGQLIKAKVDLVLGNDITSPVAIKEFEKASFEKVFNNEKIVMVMDHFVPNKDIKAAEQCRICREFASKHNITHYYDVGDMGIEHALLPEKGLIAPGELIIGADSHTCTYGAFGAFGAGVGSTDMAGAMAVGYTWFKVPAAIKFNFTGSLKENVSGKDVILNIIGNIGVDGALYKSMEFMGSGLSALTIDDRATIANMAVEAGAKNGVFEVDDITINYLNSVNITRDYTIFKADEDAVYEKTYDINLSEIEPTIACPHLPDNIKNVSDIENEKIKIDQVVIGSCTNGRLSDMKIAADILKDKRVHKDVRCIIIPATQKIYKECIKNGYIEIFIDAGCAVSTPTCGPCLGGYMGILAKNEIALTTTNRNFVGRMGHETSKIYLSSPATAATSALTGYITEPK